MKNFFCFLTLILCSFFIGLPTSSYAQNSNSYLVPVGGGPINNEFVKAFVSLSKKQNPTVLIIPYASSEKSVPETNKKNFAMFKKIGIANINALDTAQLKEAVALIKSCDIIWMPGGLQTRLRKALEKVDLDQEILKRYKQGNVVIGGTSAGASIMSEVMMASSEKDPATGELTPIISYGLKLWPETIIDQHFSERKRLGRLKKAVAKNTHLLGIGIDESTGLIYNSKERKGTVLGKGTVTFISSKKSDESKEVVLKAGESYTF